MNLRRNPVGILIGAILLLAAASAQAIPGTYTFVEDGRCDDPVPKTLLHELGESLEFAADELISAIAVMRVGFACPKIILPPDPPPVDYIVTIENLSPFKWIDLYFVADVGIVFGNVDGKIKDGDAFKIDKEGDNKPLEFESIADDLIFAPGEVWKFIVQGWTFPAPPDLMGSIGVGSESDDTTGTSWSSIVAICLDCPTGIPEPGSLPLAALGLGALGAALRRRAA